MYRLIVTIAISGKQFLWLRANETNVLFIRINIAICMHPCQRGSFEARLEVSNVSTN